MIIAVVGEDRPFDRLVRALDLWAAASGEIVEAQIGDAHYRPSHIAWHRALSMAWLAETLPRADLVVTHASLDIIRRSLAAGIPVVVLPRHPMFGEDSSDGQLLIAEQLAAIRGVHVADTEAALASILYDPAVRIMPNDAVAMGLDLSAALARIPQAEVVG